ncbi:CynX/NimT family MFS transporter, partial [Propionicimonas sp.]|uniref:MFS transporter n=1 Tax=Propionicimonas sp. TaxID=1955623 RepID=UPI0039E41FC9
GAHPGVRRRAGLPDPAPAVRAPDAPVVAKRLPAPLRRLTVLLTVAFSAHTLAYYAVTAWLPSALAELRGMTALQAGVAASLFQAAGVVGPLLVPVLAGPARWSSRRILVAVAVGWTSLPAGMLLAPSLWALWSVAAGMAQGAFFAAIMAVLIRRARSVDENRRAVARMQTFGYCVAAVGPVLVGWLHQQVAGWTAPFLVMLAMVLVMGATSVAAVREPSAD